MRIGAAAACVLAMACASGAGCATILGVDKDYEEVAGDDASVTEGQVGDATTQGEAATGEAGGDPDTGTGEGGPADGGADAPVDAPFDGTAYAALGSGDIRLYYARSVGDVWYRTWSFASKTWQPAVKIVEYTGIAVPWVAPAIGKGGGEMLGVLHVTNGAGAVDTLLGQPGWPVIASIPNAIPGGRVAHRGFDVAIESASGDGLVVYADGTGSPKFRTRKGGVTSAAAPVFASPPGADAVDWVRLVSHPRSDEISLVYTDVALKLHAAVWNGTTWSTATTLDSIGVDGGTNIADFASFAAAYEDLSGDLLVMWSRASSSSGANDPVLWSTKPEASAVFTAAQLSTYGQGRLGGFGPISAASEPGTNRIVFSSEENATICLPDKGCNDYGVGVWDGAAWGTASIVDLDGNIGVPFMQRPGSLPVAAAWLGTTGRAITVYSKTPAGALNWASWTAGGGWVLETPATMTPALAQQASFSMVRIPPVGGGTGDLVLFIEDINGSVWAKRYDGTAWTDMNGGSSVADNVRVNMGVSIGAVSR